MVAYGKLAAFPRSVRWIGGKSAQVHPRLHPQLLMRYAPVLERALKKEDLPTLGSPTRNVVSAS